jgi:hypothetical protein
MDDFHKMDLDAGVEGVAVMEVPSSNITSHPNGVTNYRDKLVRQYHDGSSSLLDRLRSSGQDDAQALLSALIQEVIRETDHLLGNQLVATENNDLRDASVISFKRAEVLEKAIKAVSSKNQMEKESGIDVDSPSMAVVFKFFMSKTKAVFDSMGMAEEQSDLFFTQLGEFMKHWKRELREEFEAMKTR